MAHIAFLAVLGSFLFAQAHRGGRGNTVESTLPSFAWGLIDGSTTLELDNGITLVAERVVMRLGFPTTPQVPNDPMFPYVGKLVANLTLAQIQTLDCGSQRQANYPQLNNCFILAHGIPTLKEVFEFVSCADPSHRILWNIESKIDARFPNRTAGKQHSIFRDSPYYRSITYQSFDWRTLVAMKELDPKITTSALIDEIPRRILKFTTQSLIDEAHRLGMRVKPWTVNRLDIADELLLWGADGIITDYPNVVRRWAKQQGLSVAPKYPKQRVFSCLEKHMQKV
ncbi:PLC-like phosphodiesterase [Pisolithus microcarpus]|nr:PLC-like phosphodiesterase [Pisolithus microcarpus]